MFSSLQLAMEEVWGRKDSPLLAQSTVRDCVWESRRRGGEGMGGEGTGGERTGWEGRGREEKWEEKGREWK